MLDILKLYVFSLLLLLSCVSPAYAASAKLVTLKNGRIYASYDVTGDGIKDKLIYHAQKGTVTVNGKSQKLFAAVSNPDKVRVFYYSDGKRDEYILIEYAKSTAIKTCSGFRYSNGRFRKACEPMGGFSSCRIGRLSGSNLILYTSPSSGAATKSFTGIPGKPFEFEETYRIDSSRHIVERASNFGKIRNAKSYYYAAKKILTTSTKGSVINNNGPKLTYGAKVTLGRVRFNYTGTDASKGSRTFEMTFDGKTGWFKENAAAQFVKNDPWAGETVDILKMDMPFSDFMEMIGCEKQVHTVDEFNFKYSTWSGNGIYYNPESLDFENGTTRLYISNSGNKHVSCGGVKIGMDIDEAERIYKEYIFDAVPPSESFNRSFSRTDENNICRLRFLNYYDIDELYYYVLELTVKNNKVSAYVYDEYGYY